MNVNNNLPSNVTSTNSSLHTNLFASPRSTFLNFAVFSSRSVRNKIESIIDHVVENDIGLYTVTETWLNDADSVSISELSVAGYFFKNFSRQSQNRGGGTGILFRDSVNVSLVDGRENKSFEYSEWIVKVHDRSMRHIIVYRPPYSSLHPVSASVFFDEFSQFLENVVMCPEVLVIFGDFNFHLDDLRDNDTKKFKDLLETFSLSQHVSGLTHLSGHTLDLIITRSSDDVVLASPKATFPISDHFIIQCPIGFRRPALSCKELTFRKLKNIDIAELSADIASSMLCASVHWNNIDALSEFGTFFLKKIEIIKENLDKFQVQEPRLAPVTPKENLENFSSLSIGEMFKIVRESSNASCRLDPVPTWLVKSCLDVLAPSFTEMVNLSLLSGCVPENWRTAVVIPLLKKPGLDLVYKNFRPVSNLPFISKVVEKAALQQLLVHCEKNAPLAKFQSCFRKYHSTETALLKVQNDILMSMDNKEVTLLVLLDLSAAFDTIEHSILLNILHATGFWSRRICFKLLRLISVWSQTTYTCR